MTINELKTMANDKICFGDSNKLLLIRSLAYKYVDFVDNEKIESIEKVSDDIVLIKVPNGTTMGTHEIKIDFSTGLVIADGKVFNEEIQSNNISTTKKRTKKFTPTINGFSISSIKTMPSTDGYAIYCKVYFNGKKIGDFVDNGDGGIYKFTANKPFDSYKIEDVVRDFPPTVRDFGYGVMEVPYDMGQMIDNLLEMEKISKEIKKQQLVGRDYVLIDDVKTGKRFSAMPLNTVSDEELSVKIREDLSSKGITDFEIRRYRSLEDLQIVNKIFVEDMLK